MALAAAAALAVLPAHFPLSPAVRAVRAELAAAAAAAAGNLAVAGRGSLAVKVPVMVVAMAEAVMAEAVRPLRVTSGCRIIWQSPAMLWPVWSPSAAAARGGGGGTPYGNGSEGTDGTAGVLTVSGAAATLASDGVIAVGGGGGGSGGHGGAVSSGGGAGGMGGAGTLNITSGATVTAGGTIYVGGASTTGTGAGGAGILNLSGGSHLSGTSGMSIQNTGTLNIGGTTANADTGGTLSLGSGLANNGAIHFNQTDAISLAQAITGSGSVSQSGSGTTTLSGINTYAGGTMITGGTLVADNASALGIGIVNIANGAVLEVGANGLTLGNTATLIIDGTLKITSADALINLYNAGYTFDGYLDLSAAFDSTAAGTYQLINATSGNDIGVDIIGFNNPNLTASFLNGTLTLQSVPEPSVAALFAIGAGAIGMIARRRR